MNALLAGDRERHQPVTSVHREWLGVTAHLDPMHGGIATMLPELSAALASDPASTARLLGMCSASEAAFVPQPMRQSTSTIPASRWGWLFDSKWRRELTSQLAGADVVHIHGLWEEHCVAAARAAQALGKPYLISAHGMLETWALRNKRFKKLVYALLVERANLSGAACLHALTQAEAEDYRRFGATNPIAIIPNGVHVPRGVSGEEFLDLFPQLGNRRLALFLGRIHYKKGLDLLVRSWRQVAEAFPDAHLVLAGPDCENTQEAIAREIASLGLSSRVTFTGMLSGSLKWSALAASEFFTLPSYSEGFSMSVLEAMGMGKPVVVTRQCNVPEVTQYDCGWTIEPDVAALTSALLEAFEVRPARRREMGVNGIELVQRQFSWESVGDRMRAIYEWTLGGAPTPDLVFFP